LPLTRNRIFPVSEHLTSPLGVSVSRMTADRTLSRIQSFPRHLGAHCIYLVWQLTIHHPHS